MFVILISCEMLPFKENQHIWVYKYGIMKKKIETT